MMQMPDQSDAHLLQLFRDPRTRDRGFRGIVEKYRERLYHQTYRVLRQHEDTDDALQNTLVKAYRGLDRFAEQASLYTWLYRIATNEALTQLNKRKRQQHLSLHDAASSGVAQLAADPAGPDGETIEAKLQAAMTTLPEKQRMVFELRYFDETPYREMSTLLATSEGALKASYHHAVKKIEAYLRAQE